MASGDVAAFHARHLERDYLAVECGDDPVQRPHPAERAFAPPHGLRPGHFYDGPGQNLGKHLCPGAALARDHSDIELALGAGAFLALVEPAAARLEEACDG